MTLVAATGPMGIVGKTCPYCQYPIKDAGTAFICPLCGIPHHRECWEENDGCTTFGCEGTRDQTAEHLSNRGAHGVRPPTMAMPPAAFDVARYCTSCGRQVSPYAAFCPICDSRITAPSATAPVSTLTTVASIGKRFVAMLLDLFITWLVLAVAADVFYYAPAIRNLFFLGLPLFYGAMLAIYGMTPGKGILGLRVVSARGGPAHIGQVLARETIGRLLSSFFLLGYLAAFGDDYKQTWHDRIAGTIVVDIRNHI